MLYNLVGAGVNSSNHTDSQENSEGMGMGSLPRGTTDKVEHGLGRLVGFRSR